MKNKKAKSKKKRVVVSIVPTGIACAIGGYIGDATIATNKLASVCDYVITNPNAVNAGAFNFKEKNVLYIEGAALDNFFEGKIEFQLPRKNTIGAIIEDTKEKVSRDYVLKAIEAFREVAGVRVRDVEFIAPLKKEIRYENGQFCADVANVEPLCRAAEKLLKKGAHALALSSHIPFDKKFLRRYQHGQVPNPYGLLEALLSHTITHLFNVPAAHAPVLTKNEIDLYLFNSSFSDPRSSFENISGAYIGSVLLGLDRAPRFAKKGKGSIALDDITALVIPHNCLRSIPTAAALEHKIPIIEVRENTNIFKTQFPVPRTAVHTVRTYDEAARKIMNLT